MALYPPELADADPDDFGYPVRSRVRVLMVAAVGPLFMGYAAVVALLAVVLSVATKADISTGGVLFAALPGWLGAHQVPLNLGGHEWGALPLLPTLLILLLVGRAATNAADRLVVDSARDVLPIIGAIAASHAIAGAAIAETTGKASVAAGLLVPALVAAIAATIGLLRRGYLADLLERCDEMVVHGLKAGLIGLAAMLGIGAALVVLGLAVSFPTVAALFSPGIGDSTGIFLLSVAYLPNAVLGGTAFAAGPGVSIGQLAATPLHFTGGPLPAVPVLAALPEYGQPWWPLVFLLPLGAGAFVGWMLRNSSEDPIARLRAVGAAAVLVAGSCVLLGIGSGGRLAAGVFNPLSVHPWSLGVAVLLWIALPAATVAWWAGPRLVLTPSRGLLDDAIEAEAAAEEAPSDEEGSQEEISQEEASEEAEPAQQIEEPAEPEPEDVGEPAEEEPDLPEEIEK